MGPPAPQPPPTDYPKHIILPFDLRDDPKAIFNEQNRGLLVDIFPGTYAVSIDGGFLHLYQHEMPRKPWPKTVAGLPLYFAQGLGPENTPRLLGLPFPSAKSPRIAKDMDGWKMRDPTPLFHAIRAFFEAVEIPITEVIYWGDYVTIVLEKRDTDLTKVLGKAGGIACMYHYEDVMGRPQVFHAKRTTDPTPGNPDNSEYDRLQPGVRITSLYLPTDPDKFLETTAGVLVRDMAGNEFMTAAAHGLPPSCGTHVMHPDPKTGRRIGEAMLETTHTDIAMVDPGELLKAIDKHTHTHTHIAMVRLSEGENFSNVTFQSDVADSIQLKKFLTLDQHRIGDTVLLDSPDTGCVEGTLMGVAFRRVGETPKQHWIKTKWVYMGQGTTGTLSNGVCGSAIRTDEGGVVGFFWYAPSEGAMIDYCCGTASDELVARGYTLVDTSGR